MHQVGSIYKETILFPAVRHMKYSYPLHLKVYMDATTEKTAPTNLLGNFMPLQEIMQHGAVAKLCIKARRRAQL